MIELALPYQRRVDTNERLGLGRRYPARLARQLALAHALQTRVDDGEFVDYADMARALGLSRARITQLMDMLLLAPSIQEELLHLECFAGHQPLPERRLRLLTRTLLWSEQREAWQGIQEAGALNGIPRRNANSAVERNEPLPAPWDDRTAGGRNVVPTRG